LEIVRLVVAEVVDRAIDEAGVGLELSMLEEALRALKGCAPSRGVLWEVVITQRVWQRGFREVATTIRRPVVDSGGMAAASWRWRMIPDR
jgi:hypothetical protein